MSGSQHEKERVVSASLVLERLHDSAPPDRLTLSWALDRLQNQSFGLILVLLAVAAVAPGICMVAGVLIAIVAFQLMIGRGSPYFPDWVANRPLPTRHLGPIVTHAISMLKLLEKGIYPRWPGTIAATRRVVGVVILILSLRLLLAPLPLSNVGPALVILLISLAYLEEDGLSLVIALALGVGTLAIDYAVLLELLRAASGTWAP